ncbi:hypothetical protein [Bernardetia sp.]|uniref:hypothetical protein n=1 Tax=Bernardetia sp. TaxID=1937974 RepID=UPI0025C0F475|nr:hypothetical protein [Bernardetia sp.]
MQSKKSIQKKCVTFLASLGCLALATSSTLAQDYQTTNNTISNFRKTSSLESQFSKTIQSNYLSSFSINEIKDDETQPWEKRIGITGAFGESSTSLTAGFSHLYGFGSSRRFKLGYGIRLSSFFGSDRKFSAAPPDLASEDNPQVFITESSQLNAINLGLYTDYSVTENLLLGFNIDIVGFSFGGEKDGVVIVEPAITGVGVPDTAKPTSFNLLLVGNNDIGTLNSEFWIGYRIASNVMIRGAFSYLFTEYTTEGQYQDDNDHFRYKATQGALGVSYTF